MLFHPTRFFAGVLACLLTMVSSTVNCAPNPPIKKNSAVYAGIATVTDLQQWIRQSHQNHEVPVLLFYREDCPFCQKVARQHLSPLSQRGITEDGVRVSVRKFNVNERHRLIDFQGMPTTFSAFAQRERKVFVPMVAFYNAQGTAAHAPIIGALLDDFYQSYLNEAIANAALSLPH